MALRRHLRTTALLLTSVLLLASCSSSSGEGNGIPSGAISAKVIADSPLSHLHYPGSKPFYLLDAGSGEQSGSAPAYAGAILTSSATGAQIYAWYKQKLKSLGWSFVTDNGCLDTQLSCPQFGHDGHGKREAFFLAIDNPALLRSVIGQTPPPACTVYEMSYEIYPPGGIRVPDQMRWNGGNQCWWTGNGWRKPSDAP
jgi:hypothetical protein